MKRGDWRLWLAFLALITFVGLLLENGLADRLRDRIEHSSRASARLDWLDAD